MRGLLTSIAVVISSSSAAVVGQIAPTPTIQRSRPLGAARGETVALEIQGTSLEGVSSLLFEDERIQVSDLKASSEKINANVSIPKDQAPGPFRYRVLSPKGLSRPAAIWVGRDLPSIKEAEPNDAYRKPQVVRGPVAIDGEISHANDVDVYAIDMEKGETLVAEAIAARAGSGLDPVLSILTEDAREIASDDDLFGRDAAVWATAPNSGRYLVQIQDANGRPRDANQDKGVTRDYRLIIGRVPLVVSAFPPGGRRGWTTAMRLDGVNFPDGPAFRFDIPTSTSAGDYSLIVTNLLGQSNTLNLRIGDARDVVEDKFEPADDPLHAPVVTVPAAINGRFRQLDDGDTDLWRLKPEPGQEGDYVITAYSARVGSSADPVLTVLNEKGAAQGEDDDKLGRDARIERRIDSDGIVISVRDYFNRGGDRFFYRIEVEPLPKLGVSADAGAKSVLPRSGTMVLPLTVERHGYDGALTVAAEGLPLGVKSEPVEIAEKGQSGLLSISATDNATLGPFTLYLSTRGVPVSVLSTFRVDPGPPPRTGLNLPNGGRPLPIDPSPRALFAITEQASLGLSIEPADGTVKAGESLDFKFRVHRRNEDAKKKPVKLRPFTAGALEGLELPKEEIIPVGKDELILTLKAKPDAAPRRLTLSARAWLEGGNEEQGIDASPVPVAVVVKAK
jgi:hypothetical protein